MKNSKSKAKVDRTKQSSDGDINSSRLVKLQRRRVGISIPLVRLSKSENIEKVFGAGVCRLFASLSEFDVRSAVLTRQQKSSVRDVSNIINDTINQQLNTDISFFSETDFERLLISGDPKNLITNAANAIARWKKCLPKEYRRELEAFRFGNLVNRLRRARKASPMSATYSSDDNWAAPQGDWFSKDQGQECGSLIWAGSTIATIGLIEIICCISEWVNEFSNIETHIHMMGDFRFKTITDAVVDWDEDWFGGTNTQEFYLAYSIQHVSGQSIPEWSIDSVDIDFEARFEGGGFDELYYPFALRCWNGNTGMFYPSVDKIESTLYHQKHRMHIENAGRIYMEVNKGIIDFGSDGLVTCVAVIPRVTVTHGGKSYTLPEGESIWNYGLAI